MGCDVLTDVLETIRLETVVHGRLELSAPWAARLDRGPGPLLYVVLRGGCWLDIDGVPDPIMLAPGDTILLTHGQSHVARDRRTTRPLPLRKILTTHPRDESGVLRYGGNGHITSMVCAYFTLQVEANRSPLACLPPALHVKHENRAALQWLDATLQFLASETATARPGWPVIVRHLVEVLLIHTIRLHVLDVGSGRGWVQGLTDPQIAGALGLLHRYPERAWRVDLLAARVHMSRSAFFSRFMRLIGESPRQYLIGWRMRKGLKLLREGHLSAKEVAHVVGYRSEAAFARAFRRFTGTPPSAVVRTRHQHRNASANAELGSGR